MLALMVADTQITLEELIHIFKNLPKAEQMKMREAFKKLK